ncbi:MAG TPA: DJ-1/PfpI family protein [Chloroflexi bacterium]|nr:DJ-1/PfpI family protein [Chloroflexota bacterium]
MRKLPVLLLTALLVLTTCKSGPTHTAEPTTEGPTPPAVTEVPPGEPTMLSPLPTESPLPTPEPPGGGDEGTGAVLLVIAPEDFRDEEYAEPRAVLEAAGYAVVVASLSLDVATGMLGMEVQPDLLLADVRVPDYDAIVFIGGNGATVYWDAPEAYRVAQEAAEQGKGLAAICIAPVILARAGVLAGREATVFDPDSLCAELEAGGATCTGVPVQRDGRIVTARSPDVAGLFAETIVEVLQEP